MARRGPNKPGQGQSKRERVQRRTTAARDRASAESELLETLYSLRQVRAPYDQLLGELVGETLRNFPPLPDRPAVEVGAGVGQLRRWLPVPLREVILHTDPSAQALKALSDTEPGARTAVASAQKLPFADGGCGGVLGLCVFDTLHAAGVDEAAVSEFARVLAPGGRFVHLLDMATLLDRPMEQFHEQGVVPLPNAFGNPGDHEWPLDVVLFEQEWLSQLLHFALRIQHPLVTAFGPYFAAFLLEPFDRKEALRRFKALATDSAAQKALAGQLAAVIQLAVQHGHPARSAIPFHSGQYLATVMREAFSRNGSFRVEACDIVARSCWRPAEGAGEGEGQGEGGMRYRSLCLGHERLSDRQPRRFLSAPSGRDELPAGRREEPRILVEAGMFVFVARRL